jgi:glycerophosphoryl diester phosphodiesterase
MPETRRSPGLPLIIAHRGASVDHPENSIAAFLAAAAAGADLVELDVRVTADHRLAVHHDARLPDGRAIAETASPDLPASVPSLAAALDACTGMGVNVEIKSDSGETDAADLVVALVDQRGHRDKVLVSSFEWAVIERVHALDPALATALLVVAPAAGDVERVAAAGHRALHPWFAAVTAELVQRCHAAEIAVNCWTCDDPERMAEMAAWGIDGICTNDPALARRALAGTP